MKQEKRPAIGDCVTVTVERPKGSYHPEHPTLYYIEGVLGGDGEELDAYILGVDTPLGAFTGRVIAVIHRLDDVEDKLVVAPEGMTFTREEILAATAFGERFFTVRVEMEEG